MLNSFNFLESKTAASYRMLRFLDECSSGNH